MAGTFEGLAVPVYGEFYRYSAAQTQNLYVEDDGVTNYTIAKTAADNAIALTLTDGSTLTSGYVQGYYCSLTTSGSYSTGNTQINAIAVDLFLGGTVACEAEGMYIYVAASGSPTVTGADISGIVVYLANVGASASYAQCLFLHYHQTNEATQSSYIFLKGEGGTSPQAAIMFHGQFPDYFIKTIASQSSTMIQNITAGGTTDKVLTCLINGSTYWIPLYAASA